MRRLCDLTMASIFAAGGASLTIGALAYPPFVRGDAPACAAVSIIVVATFAAVLTRVLGLEAPDRAADAGRNEVRQTGAEPASLRRRATRRPRVLAPTGRSAAAGSGVTAAIMRARIGWRRRPGRRQSA